MHILYKVIFPIRKSENIFPYYYIGSKSNCSFKDGKIYDKNGKIYWGSSSWTDYQDIVNSDDCYVEIISVHEDYNEILLQEKDIHLQFDVAASCEYFNKSVATINNFSDPNCATYKHISTGKIVRLDKNHELVLNGTYVGITKGCALSDIHKLKIARNGDENAFFGKKHTEETKLTISVKNKGRIKSQEEIDNWVEKVAKLPMSGEHKSKISKSNVNKVMLKNFDTGEVIKVSRENLYLYDNSVWKNPATYQKRKTCEYCGITTTVGNIVRWHDDKCKMRGLNEN